MPKGKSKVNNVLDNRFGLCGTRAPRVFFADTHPHGPIEDYYSMRLSLFGRVKAEEGGVPHIRDTQGGRRE
jgi:hypothetical protein